MKKINSIIMAALVAAASLFSFTSCGTDPEDLLTVDASIMDQATGKVALEQTLGKVAQLWSITTGGETNLSSTYETYLDQLIKNGNTIIAGLPQGTYEIRVFDGTNLNTANVAKKQFTISTTTTGPDWTTATGTITANGTYAYQRGSDIGTSNPTGTIVVSGISTASVTVKLDNYAAVTLSDAGSSWLLTNGTTANQSTVNGLSSFATVFGAKKGGAAQFISPELSGSSAANGIIQFVAIAQ
ncbi:MAG: hypothetical protein LBU90_02620 [Bacteroidales bacterium]|jgi:hypothetical protein|nr:hypothetical protein [Bacteroidales bacterium]